MSYRYHHQNPLNNAIPDFYKHKYTFHFENLEGTFYINLKDDDMIESFNYSISSDKYIALFSALSEIVTGIFLKDILTLSWEDFLDYFDDEDFESQYDCGKLPFINIALLSAQDFVREFYGRHDFSQPDSFIICRCFNISLSNINEIFLNSKNKSFEAISKITNAGLGCTRCQNDLKEIIRILNRDYAFNVIASDLGGVELFASSFIDLLNKDEGFSNFMKMNILDFQIINSEGIYFEVSNKDKWKVLIKEMEKLMEKQYGFIFPTYFIEKEVG